MRNNILFAVPTNDYILPRTNLAIAGICRREDIEYISITGSPTDQVRNGLGREILARKELTHLMMMDSDAWPYRMDDAKMVDLLLDCNADVATAITPISFKGKIFGNVVVKTDDDPDEHFITHWEDKTEPFEVLGTGCGCILIKREVFEKTPWPWFRYLESEKEGARTGEDVFFSIKIREHGFKIVTNPFAVCDHCKRIPLMSIVEAFNIQRKHYESYIKSRQAIS